MTLDSSQIELPGCEIEKIEQFQDTFRLRFARAYILKSMTGSKERTRWWQSGDLVIDGVEEAPPTLPDGPLVCAGGDIEENVYTYRDTIPVPFSSRGAIRCILRFEGRPETLVVSGREIRLEMADTPKYIEHMASRSI